MTVKQKFIVLAVYPLILLACQFTQGVPSTTNMDETEPTPQVDLSSSTTENCSVTLANYDLPHESSDINGKGIYDLVATNPSDTYLSVSAIVTEAQHLVSESDSVDGTLVFAHIDDPIEGGIHQYYVLIFLPDGGSATNQLTEDSKITASGPYVGYVYPPKNFFIAFPNENEDTKFPSIKAETASYGCP